MIVVTGGAGFVGSNIVKALNQRGRDDIIVVDDLTAGEKFANIADLAIADYRDKDDFLSTVQQRHEAGKHVRAIIHQGACTDTTEWDGRLMMQENFEYSKQLLHYCVERHIPFIYASSASVYGSGPGFSVDPAHERPLNVYGYSKLLFDQYVRRHFSEADSQVVGLRYFNVYGPREAHKGGMASVAWHFNRQVSEQAEARLFEGSDGYDSGEQRRDFVYVDDVAAVNLFFLDHPGQAGIYNVGTGASQSFNDVANAVIGWHGRGTIRYIPFPEHLIGHYQSFTEADISGLRQAGYRQQFRTVEQGVSAYLDELGKD
ncbi:MAG: ADP-glyceromanno-heptose 6-epimerase [Gammaproteobacteria bacterium]|nr:ADP-glyceromanno-heptose 6-epimerase [Gammaproteobacteria bacterium]NNF61439.1 ADP-glyceromanno-heptose 6-epimerase [Gammaproteobacteria bacterium]NNM20186.1 ADP-glyceromanno-heptose 6-epimerase [Gammaproteobacteria bacterium]